MTNASAQAELPAEPVTFVSNDMAALALHMDECRRSRGRFFSLNSAGDAARRLVLSHIVSTGALLSAAGLVASLAFG